MGEQLISFEVAKLAKEKGFWLTANSWRESMTFYREGKLIQSALGNDCDFDSNECYAPTQSLLQKWLRDKYNIMICVRYYTDTKYELDVYYPRTWNERSEYVKSEISSYEEALEVGLLEGLKLIEHGK